VKSKLGEPMNIIGLIMIAVFAYMTCDVIATINEKYKDRRGDK